MRIKPATRDGKRLRHLNAKGSISSVPSIVVPSVLVREGEKDCFLAVLVVALARLRKALHHADEKNWSLQLQPQHNPLSLLDPTMIRSLVQARPTRAAFSSLAPAQRSFSTAPSVLQEERPSTTHFGFRDVPSSSKESLVANVFSSVASSYDIMNDAMSLGIHRLWKNHFVSRLDPCGGIHILDVAGGTGDIALRLLDHARTKHVDRDTKVTLLDINPEMLREGMVRFKRDTMYWNTPQLAFQLGNAESLDSVMEVPPAKTRLHKQLPALQSVGIPSESVDLYTIAFGIRNCTHIDKVLQEAHRVLKPGGVFACLEFGKVGNPILNE